MIPLVFGIDEYIFGNDADSSNWISGDGTRAERMKSVNLIHYIYGILKKKTQHIVQKGLFFKNNETKG